MPCLTPLLDRVAFMRSLIHPNLVRTSVKFLTVQNLYVPLAFILLMYCYAPMHTIQDFDYDEGINLMKALLYSRGYVLYTEIWSDQPPLMTVLLAGLLRLVGTSVVAARSLIVVLAALLVWAFYNSTRRAVSAPAALGATVLLVISEEYIRLSASVMIGLPSLALGVMAAYLLLRGQARHRMWLVAASGAFMAVSLQTKLITVVMVPAFVAHMLIGIHTNRVLSLRLRQFTLWLAALVFTYIAIGLGTGGLDPQTLLYPHFSEQTRGAFLNRESFSYIYGVASQHWVYLIIAVVGIGWAIWHRHGGVVFPVVWLLTAVVALLSHRPLWHHHVTLLTIPLSWLCAFGIEAWFSGWRTMRRQPERGAEVVAGWQGPIWKRRHAYTKWALALLGSVLVLFLLTYPAPLLRRIHEQTYRNRPTYNQSIVVKLQQAAKGQAGWIFTDRPYYAFQAGLSVPPFVATLSRKRIQSGLVTNEMLVHVVRHYRPRYVILERFTPLYSEDFMREINLRYDLSLVVGQARYLVDGSLVDTN